MEGPFATLVIRGGQASECQAVLGAAGAEVLGPPGADGSPRAVVATIPYAEMTEVWHYGSYVHVRHAEGEARFDVGDRRRCKRIAKMIEDAPSPLEALGARKGDLVAVMGLPEGWVLRLLRQHSLLAVDKAPESPAGLLVVGVSGRRSLPALGGLKPYMRSDGVLWVVFPTDNEAVSSTEVVAAARGMQLRDVLTIRLAPGRSAVKFVAG